MNIIDENNKTSMLLQGTSATILTPYLHAIYVSMIPWLLPAMPFILLDMKYGRLVAGMRGDEVTIFKTVRMAIDKVFTYICWIMLASTLSIAFDTIAIKIGIMAVIYGLEVLGLMKKFLLCHNIEVSDYRIFTVFMKFLWKKLTSMDDDFIEVFREAHSEKKVGKDGTTAE